MKRIRDASAIDIALCVPNARVDDVDAVVGALANAFKAKHAKGQTIQVFYVAKGAKRANALDSASAENSQFMEYYIYVEFADENGAKAHAKMFEDDAARRAFDAVYAKYGVVFKSVNTGRNAVVCNSFREMIPKSTPAVGETIYCGEFMVKKSDEDKYDQLFATHQRFVQKQSSFISVGNFEPRLSQMTTLKAVEGDKIAYTVHLVFPGGDKGVNEHLKGQKLDWDFGAMEEFNAIVGSGGFAMLGSARVIHAM